MKAFLLFRDRDLDLRQTFLPYELALMQDLELSTLLTAMARGDKLVFEVARTVLLSGLKDVDTIRYRQQILRDGLKHPSLFRDLYRLADEAIGQEKKNFWGLASKYPEFILRRSVEVLRMFVGMLKNLLVLADEYAGTLESEGLTSFFAMLRRELDADYFARVQQHLNTLQFRQGVLMSARLGQGNKGITYVLRKPPERKQNWRAWLLGEKQPAYTFSISDRDESGARALSELRGRGINQVANALAQSTDHILSFFTMVRTELAFYIGCLNLHEQLGQKGLSWSFPQPVAVGERQHTFHGLYDISLALTTDRRVVGNELHADGKDLVLITGANQGGKSTFLRGIGLAQIMMQSGMFVPAESFCASLSTTLCTHYKRKEDATMQSGKLDEELSRMSDIVDHLAPDSLVLFNESFAATNEREGAEIVRHIVSALLEKRVKVFFVTHLYEFAHSLFEQNSANMLFLRAARQADGTRTFHLSEGEPLPTSYGRDIYARIFGAES